MEHEDFVSFEQAKTLKELGFNWKCNHFYCQPEGKELKLVCYVPVDFLDPLYHDFNDPSIWSDGNENTTSAPTLSQAQKWLREIKEIEVGAFADWHPSKTTGTWIWLVRKLDLPIYASEFSKDDFDSYEQALITGIDFALEKLKES